MEEASIKEGEHNQTSNRKGSKMCCPNIFRADIKTEISNIFRLGWPTVIANICQLLLSTQSVLFCGSLGKTELAAGSLSNTIYMVFGVSVAIGLTSALDTLCAQAFGAKNFKMVGVVLQRGICILSVAIIIVCAVWMLTQHFLLLIGMESELAKMSDAYMVVLIPVLPACFGIQLLMKYIQTQGIVRPIVVVGLITNVVALGLNFLVVKVLNQGFKSVAVTLVIANYFQLVLLISYIIFRKIHTRTWKGWSIECLYDWKEFVGLSIPGMLMICLEWWTFEISSFLMGRFGESTVAANGVLLQISGLAFMVPYGISIAAGVLVGNYLGANDPTRAKLVTKLSLLMTGICTVVLITVTLSTKKHIAKAFSGNESVIKLITSTIPYMVFFAFLDALQGVCAGVIRGCGRQKLGMVINFISYDIIAIPVSIILAFVADLRLTGMWLGISAGLSVQAIVYLTILGCTNWNRQAKLAIERTSREHELKNPDLSNHEVEPLSNLQQMVTSIPDVDDDSTKKQENSEKICLQGKPEADHLPLIMSKSATDSDTETLQQLNPDVLFEPGVSPTRQVINKKKLICLRSIPYIIAFLVLCSALCVRLFVPLPGDGNYGNNTISNLTVIANTTVKQNL